MDGERMRLLDLFCGAGGCSVGYARAGFEVVGVDINPQPRYPFEFHQADAMTFPLDGFDVIHASPPCQTYSITRHTHSVEHPDLLGPTRGRLRESGLPYVIENVVGAPMPGAIELCGAAFNLHAFDPKSGLTLWLKRHRWFESNRPLWGPGGCFCKGKQIGGVYGGGSHDIEWAKNVRKGGYTPPVPVMGALLGVDWMREKELHQAIPPAYTEFIGAQLLERSGVA
jgi:DNA (cytosine-5)-methyltransferase 1